MLRNWPAGQVVCPEAGVARQAAAAASARAANIWFDVVPLPVQTSVRALGVLPVPSVATSTSSAMFSQIYFGTVFRKCFHQYRMGYL